MTSAIFDCVSVAPSPRSSSTPYWRMLKPSFSNSWIARILMPKPTRASRKPVLARSIAGSADFGAVVSEVVLATGNSVARYIVCSVHRRWNKRLENRMNSQQSRKRWFALALIVAAQFMVVLDVAIVNVALPSIKTDLGFSQESLQWVVTSYSILFGGALLL